MLLRRGSTTIPRKPTKAPGMRQLNSWVKSTAESLMGNRKRGSGCVCSYICDNFPPIPGDKKLPFLLLILMFLSLSWHFSLILSLLPFINVWHIYYIKTHSPLNSKVMTFMEHQPENMKLKLYSKFNQTASLIKFRILTGTKKNQSGHTPYLKSCAHGNFQRGYKK